MDSRRWTYCVAEPDPSTTPHDKGCWRPRQTRLQPLDQVLHPWFFAVCVTDDDQPLANPGVDGIAHILVGLPLVDLATYGRVRVVLTKRHHLQAPTGRANGEDDAAADHLGITSDPHHADPELFLDLSSQRSQ